VGSVATNSEIIEVFAMRDSVDVMLAQAESAGLKIWAEGDRLKIKGPRSAEPLAKEIISRKPEVLEHLRAQAIASMSLEQFRKGFLAVRVWSKVLNRHLWFVSHPRAAHELGVKGLYFTGQELAELLRINPTPKDLLQIVEAKETFDGKLTGSLEGYDENHLQ
jgi:hypothetical protein